MIDDQGEYQEQTGHIEHSSINGSVRKTARARMIQSIGVLLLGVSALFTAGMAWRLTNTVDNLQKNNLGLRESNDELRHEQECRFDVSSEVNTINERLNAQTAEIFVAAVEHPGLPGQPSAEVREVTVRLEQTLKELVPAQERRNEAVEICERD